MDTSQNGYRSLSNVPDSMSAIVRVPGMANGQYTAGQLYTFTPQHELMPVRLDADRHNYIPVSTTTVPLPPSGMNTIVYVEALAASVIHPYFATT